LDDRTDRLLTIPQHCCLGSSGDFPTSSDLDSPGASTGMARAGEVARERRRASPGGAHPRGI